MGDKTFKIVNGDMSDGYHTFDELYEHRCLLYLAWLTSDGYPGGAYWVADHFPGWDLVVCSLGGQQISYHVPEKYRDILDKHFVRRDATQHVFDGHTSADVAARIEKWLRD